MAKKPKPPPEIAAVDLAASSISAAAALAKMDFSKESELPPQEFHSLPCVGGAEFERCGWIGICSNARKECAFYVDNLHFQPDSTVPR